MGEQNGADLAEPHRLRRIGVMRAASVSAQFGVPFWTARLEMSSPLEQTNKTNGTLQSIRETRLMQEMVALPRTGDPLLGCFVAPREFLSRMLGISCQPIVPVKVSAILKGLSQVILRWVPAF